MALIKLSRNILPVDTTIHIILYCLTITSTKMAAVENSEMGEILSETLARDGNCQIFPLKLENTS
jgi:hypothetical protein